MASKSDVPAKAAYIEKILAEGFDTAEVRSEPSDIVATKGGETWYFEIKMTSKTDSYFGAATLTEWEQAFKTPERFFFVVAIKGDDGKFDFRKYTPIEFMKYSTIPPFKIFFNLDLEGGREKKRTRRTAIGLTKDNFAQMNALFLKMREDAASK